MAKTPKKPAPPGKPKSTKKRGKIASLPTTPPPLPPPPAPPPDEDPLSPTERQFVENYLVDGNATRAYRETLPGVSYAAARTNASRMLALPHIRREIEAGRAMQVRRHRLRASDVMEEIIRIAYSDPVRLLSRTGEVLPLRDVPEPLRRAVASVEVCREHVATTRNGQTRTTTTTRIIKYRFWNKMEALDRLANTLGMKTSIPPLEVLLRMLTPEVAEGVRAALLSPSQNGHQNGGVET